MTEAEHAPMLVAGRWRGLRLAVAPGQLTRPMRARLRESLFALLGDVVVGARVLDLFAGSGALGLEALSRGAAHCTFVERAAPALRALRSNVEACGLAEPEARLLALDADSWVPRAEPPYGLVFLDPPFARPLVPPPVLLQDGVLAAGALLSLQIPIERAAPARFGPFALQRRRAYGSSVLLIYELTGLDCT